MIAPAEARLARGGRDLRLRPDADHRDQGPRPRAGARGGRLHPRPAPRRPARSSSSRRRSRARRPGRSGRCSRQRPGRRPRLRPRLRPRAGQPGRPGERRADVPRLVGGVDARRDGPRRDPARGASTTRSIELSSPDAAELAKLLENVFRNVNIALVNQLALLCERMGLDVWEVIDAAATKPFGFMRFTPGPGVGGHCIPVDPYYLSWRAREFDFVDRFVELAGDINLAMPRHVVDLVAEALNERGRALRGARVGRPRRRVQAGRPRRRATRRRRTSSPGSPSAAREVALPRPARARVRGRRRARSATSRRPRRAARLGRRVVVVDAHRAIDWDARLRRRPTWSSTRSTARAAAASASARCSGSAPAGRPSLTAADPGWTRRRRSTPGARSGQTAKPASRLTVDGRAARIAFLSYSSGEFDARSFRMARSAVEAGCVVTVYARWHGAWRRSSSATDIGSCGPHAVAAGRPDPARPGPTQDPAAMAGPRGPRARTREAGDAERTRARPVAATSLDVGRPRRFGAGHSSRDPGQRSSAPPARSTAAPTPRRSAAPSRRAVRFPFRIARRSSARPSHVRHWCRCATSCSGRWAGRGARARGRACRHLARHVGGLAAGPRVDASPARRTNDL